MTEFKKIEFEEYESEQYTARFEDEATASKWMDAKQKLLKDAGLTVQNMSLHYRPKYKTRHTEVPAFWSCSITARRGNQDMFSYDSEDYVD